MTPYKRSILQALLDGKTIQAKLPGGAWKDLLGDDVFWHIHTFSAPDHLRVKVNTIKIGDTEVPEPLREAPDAGTSCYVASIGSSSFYFYLTWDEHPSDYRTLALDRGLIHLTEDAAVQHAKALLAFTEK